MHRVACRTLLLALLLICASASTSTAQVFSVHAWTLTTGETFVGRFQRMEEDDAAIMVAGTQRLVPFEQLSHADQVFLRDGLANTTTPLRVTVRPQAVVPPPAEPKPSPVLPSQPEPTSTATFEHVPSTGDASPPPVTPPPTPSYSAPSTPSYTTSPPTYTPPTVPNYSYTPPEIKLPEPTYVPTTPPSYTPISTSSSDGSTDTPIKEVLGGIAALVSIIVGALRWLNKED
jgi:hypothetical protein